MKKSRILGRMVLAFVLCCSMCVGIASAATPDKVYNINGTTLTFGTFAKETRSQRANDVIYEVEKDRSFTTQTIRCNPNGGNYLSVTVENIGKNPIRVNYTTTINGTVVNESKVVYSNVPTPWCGFTVQSPSNTMDCSFLISVEPYTSGQAINYTIVARQFFV